MSGIEWLDLDGCQPTGASSRDLPSANRAPARPISGRSAVIAVVMAALALVTAATAWRLRSTERVETVVHTASSYTGIDATSCPVSLSCRSATVVLPSMRAAVAREFPGAEIVSSETVFEAATGRSVRTALTARTPDGLLVTAASQCVPVHDRVPSTGQVPAGAGPAEVFQVVAGLPGCSVAVAAQVAPGRPIPAAQLAAIATERDLQLLRN